MHDHLTRRQADEVGASAQPKGGSAGLLTPGVDPPENAACVSLRFRETGFHNPWSATGWASDVLPFCDALRCTFPVDDFVGVRWDRGAGGKWGSKRYLDGRIPYFVGLSPTPERAVAAGASLWTGEIEVKDFLGLFGLSGSVPFDLCLSLVESCWMHALDDGLFSPVSADFVGSASVTRVDVTVDLDSAGVDLGPVFSVLAHTYDNTRLFRRKGVTSGVYLDRTESDCMLLYDKAFQRECVNADRQKRNMKGGALPVPLLPVLPPTLRAEARFKSAFLRGKGLREVAAMTDEALSTLFAAQVEALGLDRPVEHRAVIQDRCEAAGISAVETTMLVGFLTSRDVGARLSAPTRRKYSRMAKQLGVLGILDGEARPSIFLDFGSRRVVIRDSETPHPYTDL
jgi:hypothetical protein